jgi:hypothetical protein
MLCTSFYTATVVRFINSACNAAHVLLCCAMCRPAPAYLHQNTIRTTNCNSWQWRPCYGTTAGSTQAAQRCSTPSMALQQAHKSMLGSTRSCCSWLMYSSSALAATIGGVSESLSD